MPVNSVAFIAGFFKRPQPVTKVSETVTAD